MGNTRCYPLLSLVGVNHFQPILHISKIMVHFYSIYEHINQFPIGCIINPSLNVNKMFREKVENFLTTTFHDNTMVTIRDVMKNNNTCVIAVILF